MDTKPYDGPERRKYFRYNLIYSPKERIKFKINNDLFDVLDFSQGGLRFIKTNPINVDSHIRGELIFSNGRTKEIIGEIVWELNDEIGVKYI